MKVKVGIEEDIIGMGSECKKWMIFGFVIVISFSLVMEGALATRHLMQWDIDSSLTPPPLGSATGAP